MSLYRMPSPCAVGKQLHMGDSSSSRADNTMLPFSQGRTPRSTEAPS